MENPDPLCSLPVCLAFDAFVKSQFPTITEQSGFKSSLEPSWYLQPSQHFLEIILLNVGIYCLTKKLEGVPAVVLPAKRKMGWYFRVIDWLLFLTLVGSFGLIILNKKIKGELIYMLQPCHIFTSICIILQLMPRRSIIARQLYNLTLCCGTWGTLIAILFADLRDYHSWWSIYAFWAQHYVLLLLPFYWLWLHKFEVLTADVRWCLLFWGWKSLYHWDILLPASIVAGENLNYMMTPLPGPLLSFKTGYRIAQGTMCLGLTLFARYILVGTATYITHPNTHTKHISKLAKKN